MELNYQMQNQWFKHVLLPNMLVAQQYLLCLLCKFMYQLYLWLNFMVIIQILSNI